MVRDTFLVANEVRDTATGKYVKIGNDIEQPYAQVIMLDASFGDSNVIDLCRARVSATNEYEDVFASDGVTQVPTYHRILCDTGPSVECLNNIVRVLKEFGWPKLVKTGGGPLKPFGFDEAVLDLLQLTHIDKDHSSQASGLLAKVRSGDAELDQSFVNTTMMFHGVPTLNPPFILRPVLDQYHVACVANPERVDLYARAGFRFMYQFQWQALRLGSDAPGEGDWKDFAVRPLFDPDNKNRLQVTWKDIKAGPKPFVAVRCIVRLERYLRSGHAIGWETVMAKRFSDAGNKVNMQVNWLIGPEVYEFDYVAMPPPIDTDIMKIKFRPGPAAPVDPILFGPNYFVDVRKQMDRLTHMYATMPAPKPAHPFVNPIVPLATQNSYDERVSEAWQATVVGPTKQIHAELINRMITWRFKTALSRGRPGALYGPFDNDGEQPFEDDNDIANRGSIVTMYQRWRLDPMGVRDSALLVPDFQMLFTGDAYDGHCQVSNTVLAFKNTSLQNKVDVLKVPHHGSVVTASEGFYDLFRADVYLINARQSTHDNPRFEVLEAIARGFRQTPAQFHADPVPKLLFFSDPTCLEDIKYTVKRVNRWGASHVHRLLHTSTYRPHTDTLSGRDIYNYRCFRLRYGASLGDDEYQKQAGRILFGRDHLGRVAVQFTVTKRDDKNDLADSKIDDWVEMVGSP